MARRLNGARTGRDSSDMKDSSVFEWPGQYAWILTLCPCACARNVVPWHRNVRRGLAGHPAQQASAVGAVRLRPERPPVTGQLQVDLLTHLDGIDDGCDFNIGYRRHPC